LLVDEEGWKLVLSIPKFEGSGASQAYEAVLRALQGHKVEGVPVADMIIAKSTDPLVRLLRSAIHVSGPRVGRVRFTGNAVNGHLIPDALIYRMESGSGAGSARVPPAATTKAPHRKGSSRGQTKK
jgi:hypothetical protein